MGSIPVGDSVFSLSHARVMLINLFTFHRFFINRYADCANALLNTASFLFPLKIRPSFIEKAKFQVLVILLAVILTSSNGLKYVTKQITNMRAQNKDCSVVDILRMVD